MRNSKITSHTTLQSNNGGNIFYFMAILPPGGEKTHNKSSDAHRVFAGSGLVQEAGLGLTMWYFICTTSLENIPYATSNSI